MRRSLGLEMGAAGHPRSGWMRWVELEEERGRITVRASGSATTDGAGERAVGEALRALAAERRWSRPSDRWRGGNSGREVVVSLPRSAVTLRWVTLPMAPREETHGMVELEAVQSLPFLTEESAWDFVSFPASEGRQEALMVAARRSLVAELRRQVETAGLRVGAVSVDALAATALYRQLLPEAQAGALLLHLDGGTATLSRVQEGRLLLSRSVAPQRLDAEALAIEVRRTLVAGMMTGDGGSAPSPVSAVWLTGPGADEALVEELGTLLGPEQSEQGWSAAAGSPLPAAGRVKAGLLPRDRLPGAEALPPSFDTALGLALLGLRPPMERLDLARAIRVDANRQAAGPARRLPLLAGAGAATLGIAALLLFGPGTGDRDLAAAASRAQADVRQLASRRQKLEDQVRQLSGAVIPAHSYLDVLNDVSALLGADAWLTQFTYQRGRPIVIRGTARSNDAVARLVEGLRRSPHLERAALSSVTRPETQEVSLVQFAITGSLRGDQPLAVRRSRRTHTTRQGE
jgi:Tfp pilus assembly protein PilN